MRKYYSIQIFILLLILFSIINVCSKDDSGTLCDTFLECQEGNVWIDDGSYADEITYIRFVNNEKKVLEVFNMFLPQKRDCFNNHYISEGWGELKIVENNVNKIEFIILPPDYELNTVEFIFNKSTESLKLTFNIYDEYGSLIKTTESVMIKSNVDVDELTICSSAISFINNKKSGYFK